MPRRAKPKVEPEVEAMRPRISTVDWSPKFVAQTLDVLPVWLRGESLFWMKPIHADSLRVGLTPSAKPADTLLDVLNWYPLVPVVVHSTSWRQEEGRIILTYVAVIAPPEKLPPDSPVDTPVRRPALPRGGAMPAPHA